jgi:hypothetical protein
MPIDKHARRVVVGTILGAVLAVTLAAAPAMAAQQCGGSGGGLTHLTCPTGQYVVGLSVKGGQYLDRLGIRCAPFSATGKRGAATYSASAGGSGGSVAASGQCSGDQAMVRLDLRSGTWVDKLGSARCAKRVAAGGFAPPTSGAEGRISFNVGGHKGKDCSLACPSGTAIRQIKVAHAAWIDMIEVVCAQ